MRFVLAKDLPPALALLLEGQRHTSAFSLAESDLRDRTHEEGLEYAQQSGAAYVTGDEAWAGRVPSGEDHFGIVIVPLGAAPEAVATALLELKTPEVNGRVLRLPLR